jgi:hypothetical protein
MAYTYAKKEIEDEYTRGNFDLLQRAMDEMAFNFPMQFIEIDIQQAVTKKPIKHTLGVAPKDVFLTRKTGAGDLTFLYEDFDKEFIYVSTTGAVKARFFVGTYVGRGFR